MIKFHTETEKDFCERRMGIIIRIIVFMFLVPIAICIIQFCRGIITFWNICAATVSLVIIVASFVPEVYGKLIESIFVMVEGDIETTPQEEIDREERELQEDMQKNPKKYDEMERKRHFMSFEGYYEKLKGWKIFVRILLCAGLVIGAYFSVNYKTNFENKNPGCTVVEATVVKQIDQTTVTYEDGAETERRKCIATLEYNFNGKVITKDVTFKNVDKIRVSTFDIYVDSTGKYIESVSKFTGFYILGISLLVSAFIILTSIFLKFSSIFYVGIVFILISSVCLILDSLKISVAEILNSDFTTFISVFFCVGVYIIIMQYLGRFVLVGHATIENGPKKQQKKVMPKQEKFKNINNSDTYKETEKNDY